MGIRITRPLPIPVRGESLWTNRLNSPYAADAQTMAITADPRGNAFVTGKAVTTVNGVGYYGYYTLWHLSSAGVPSGPQLSWPR